MLESYCTARYSIRTKGPMRDLNYPNRLNIMSQIHSNFYNPIVTSCNIPLLQMQRNKYIILCNFTIQEDLTKVFLLFSVNSIQLCMLEKSKIHQRLHKPWYLSKDFLRWCLACGEWGGDLVNPSAGYLAWPNNLPKYRIYCEDILASTVGLQEIQMGISAQRQTIVHCKKFRQNLYLEYWRGFRKNSWKIMYFVHEMKFVL
jgi:hypothetical protein